MAGDLNGHRVAILAADGVERVELEQPRQALDGAGARTVVVSIHDGEIQACLHPCASSATASRSAFVRPPAERAPSWRPGCATDPRVPLPAA